MLTGCVVADNVGPVGPSSYGKILPENKETKTSNSDDITDVTSSSCDEISEEDKNECFIPSGTPSTYMLYCVLYRQ